MVRGLFAVNVPFVEPILAFAPGEEFRVVGGKTVVFKPREWRGVSGKDQWDKTAAAMAAELAGLPRGAVTQIYTTSDGGFHLSDMYEMIAALPEHVEIVNHNVIVDMALQRASAGSTDKWTF